MGNIGPLNLQSLLPAQRWQCSSVEPASSPLADTEEYLGWGKYLMCLTPDHLI